jgi:PAP2 superfamily
LRPSDIRRLIYSVVTVALLLWVVGRRSFFADTISSPFLSIALLSVFLILIRTRISIREIVAVVALFLTFCAYDLNALGYPSSWPVWMSLLGIASLGGLFFRTIWSEGSEQKFAAWALGPAFLFVASEWTASYFLEWTERARPNVYDLYLYSFDASLHVQPSFALARMFAHSHIFAETCFLFYIGLPIAIGLTYAGCLMRDRWNATPAFIAFLLTGPLGALFYNFLPALGPIHLLRGDFPWHPLTYGQASRLFLETVAIPGPRNAIPSLHAAWIFLVLWYARRLSTTERICAGAFVFFTLCATLGTGEHYFVDLIVALPFTALVISLADLLSWRYRPALLWAGGAGLGTVLAWFWALRFSPKVFFKSTLIPWGAFAATLVLCAIVGRMLLESPAQAEAKVMLAQLEPSSEIGDQSREASPRGEYKSADRRRASDAPIDVE